MGTDRDAGKPGIWMRVSANQLCRFCTRLRRNGLHHRRSGTLRHDSGNTRGVIVLQRRQPGSDPLFLRAISTRLIEVPGPGQTDSGAGSLALDDVVLRPSLHTPITSCQSWNAIQFHSTGRSHLATRCMNDSGEGRKPGFFSTN